MRGPASGRSHGCGAEQVAPCQQHFNPLPLPRPAAQIEKGSLFPSACVSLYVMYICYSSMASEPRDYECNGLGQRLNAASGTTLAAGMALTLLRCAAPAGWARPGCLGLLAGFC